MGLDPRFDPKSKTKVEKSDSFIKKIALLETTVDKTSLKIDLDELCGYQFNHTRQVEKLL